MNEVVVSNDSGYILQHTHSELKAKTDLKFGVINRVQRDTGLQSGFYSLLDLVVNEASAGNNIIGEFPGFFKAMMDDEKLFDTFIKELNSVQ